MNFRLDFLLVLLVLAFVGHVIALGHERGPRRMLGIALHGLALGGAVGLGIGLVLAP